MTNNNDLTTTVAAPGGITLPDVLTESDLFMNLDSSMLMPQTLNLEPGGKGPGTMDFGSQLLSDSGFGASASNEPARLEDNTPLELDLGEDNTLGHDTSVELGRDAPAPRPVEEDLFSDNGKFNDVDLPLDLGEDDAPLDKMDEGNDAPQEDMSHLLHQEDAMDIGGDDEVDVQPREGQEGEENRFQRNATSPISSVASDATEKFRATEAAQMDHDDDVVVQHAQRAKRRKVMELDQVTDFNNNQIKAQQADRSGILKPTSFLPRDPVLLTLMNMQKSGAFVSNVLGEGRGRGWAPELRELLSFDSIKQAGELKRKRDSGISDMDVDAAKAPALELGEEEGVMVADEGVGLDSTLNQRSDEIELSAEEADRLPADDEEGVNVGADEYDDTTVQPVDSGPVSVGTKHAVHVLRDQLGDGAEQKSSVMFQDVMPEKQTTRADATKMFFEVLVLATKDAVKVDQGTKSIGSPLKVRGKRGLWGSWAEEDTDGELAGQPSQVAV